MSEEYQGAFLAENKGAHKQVPEGVDGELVKLGVKYTDRTAKQAKPVEAATESTEDQTERKSRRTNFRPVLALITGAGLLFYMVMAGKIDTAYGLVFTSAISAACGYRMK
jgi:hypothetical protein